MKVVELIDRLREFDPDAEVQVQLGSTRFAPPAWVGIADTADPWDKEKAYQIVISPWEPEDHRKPDAIQGQTRK